MERMDHWSTRNTFSLWECCDCEALCHLTLTVNRKLSFLTASIRFNCTFLPSQIQLTFKIVKTSTMTWTFPFKYSNWLVSTGFPLCIQPSNTLSLCSKSLSASHAAFKLYSPSADSECIETNHHVSLCILRLWNDSTRLHSFLTHLFFLAPSHFLFPVPHALIFSCSSSPPSIISPLFLPLSYQPPQQWVMNTLPVFRLGCITAFCIPCPYLAIIAMGEKGSDGGRGGWQQCESRVEGGRTFCNVILEGIESLKFSFHFFDNFWLLFLLMYECCFCLCVWLGHSLLGSQR